MNFTKQELKVFSKMGKKGGTVTASRMTKEQRIERARKGGLAKRGYKKPTGDNSVAQ